MSAAAWWVAVFGITWLETAISTWEGKADRQATHSRTRKWSLRAAHWAAAFELVLFADVWLLVHQGGWIIVPILLGAWIGKYHAVERRRLRWRRNVGQRIRRKRATSALDTVAPNPE